MQGLLIGAIIGSTDAAAVFSVLGAQGMRLKQRVGATLEIESGCNDPMAVFLTLVFIEVVRAGDHSLGWSMLWEFVWQFGIGGLAGVVGGQVAGLAAQSRQPYQRSLSAAGDGGRAGDLRHHHRVGRQRLPGDLPGGADSRQRPGQIARQHPARCTTAWRGCRRSPVPDAGLAGHALRADPHRGGCAADRDRADGGRAAACGVAVAATVQLPQARADLHRLGGLARRSADRAGAVPRAGRFAGILGLFQRCLLRGAGLAGGAGLDSRAAR